MGGDYNRLSQTKQYVVPDANVTLLMCSLKPFEYFSYSFKYLGINKGMVTEASFIVTEKSSPEPLYL